MSDDVTISSERARVMASTFRKIADTPGSPRASAVLREYADLIDPPLPSLRDEIAQIIHPGHSGDECPVCKRDSEAVLAVVRKRVAEDPIPGSIQGREVMYRDDVLALLGGDDE